MTSHSTLEMSSIEHRECTVLWLRACLIAVGVHALFNHGIAESWLLPAVRPLLRMLPEQVLAVPPKLCLRNDPTCHKLLMEGLQIPAGCIHELSPLSAHEAWEKHIIEVWARLASPISCQDCLLELRVRPLGCFGSA